jgi:hypothetical protein
VFGFVLKVTVLDRVYVGSLANALCLVAESLFGSAPPSTPNVVCSDLAHDFRTPGIHAFDVSSEGVWSLNDLSSVLPASAKALLSTTLGVFLFGTVSRNFLFFHEYDSVNLN